MELTDKQYDILTICFKENVPTKIIGCITHIPYSRIDRERERWEKCVEISLLEPPTTYKQLFNGGKTFGRRKLSHPVWGWQ